MFLKTFDMDFFFFITTHPKLTVEVAIPLMSLISKLCLVELSYSSAAQICYLRLIERYQHSYNSSDVTGSVIIFVNLCLQEVYEIELLLSEIKPSSSLLAIRGRYSQ